MMRFKISRSEIKSYPIYHEAVEFQENFKFNELKNTQHTDLVFEEAKRRFELMQENVREIDGKADTMIRYFTFIIGGLALFVGSQSSTLHLLQWIIMILGTLSLLFSFICALGVRAPADTAQPPNVKTVFAQFQKYENISKIKAKLALIYGRAIAGLTVLCQIKCNRLTWSHIFLIIGLILFLVCFCIQNYLSSFST